MAEPISAGSCGTAPSMQTLREAAAGPVAEALKNDNGLSYQQFHAIAEGLKAQYPGCNDKVYGTAVEGALRSVKLIQALFSQHGGGPSVTALKPPSPTGTGVSVKPR